MAYKQKKNINFGTGTGSSPNKIATELLISQGLEVGNKALELFEKGPNTESGKKYEYHTNEKLGNKPPPDRKYRIDTRSGEIHLLPEENKDDKGIEIPDWAYEATNVENPNKPKVDPPKVDPPKKEEVKEEVVEEKVVKNKNTNKKKKKNNKKFRYNI